MRVRMFRVVLTLLSVASIGGGSRVSGQTAPAAAPYLSDLRFVATMAEAKKLAGSGQILFAIGGYRKANKIAGGKCAACLEDVVDLDMKIGEYKDAAGAAAEMVAMADSPLDKSRAEGLRGQALYAQAGEKPKPAQLQAVDEVLKAAIADFPKNLSARFLDGSVLARMGQMDAAREQFEYCVSVASPSDPSYLRAKHFA